MTPPCRALVVGGQGFLGRHVCRALAGAGHDVLRISRTPAAGSLTADVAVTEPAELAALLDDRRVGLVVNAAGAVWGPTEGEAAHASNVTLVEHLVAAMEQARRTARLVHIGSGYEYGPTPRGHVLAETAAARPMSAYGRMKLRASRTVVTAAAEGRVDAVVLRTASTIGPEAPPASLLGTLAARLVQAGRVDPAPAEPTVLEFRSLVSEQDFVDVRDVADAVLAAARAETAVRMFNIGAGRVIPVRTLVHRLIEISGVPATVRERAEPALQRGGGIDWQLLDISLARDALGWTPARSPQDALRDLWHSREPPAPTCARTAPPPRRIA
ncbi:NAD-dependent epimerase/dehydratase family protein [Streptomyces acidicola]|uniref:NAD-dependent epimerase/dehydratase family protein n=1 Tax=Streptomyces acidicola TaxID=2596892 RepID=UPI0038195FBB